jgi:hypothetical protein
MTHLSQAEQQARYEQEELEKLAQSQYEAYCFNSNDYDLEEYEIARGEAQEAADEAAEKYYLEVITGLASRWDFYFGVKFGELAPTVVQAKEVVLDDSEEAKAKSHAIIRAVATYQFNYQEFGSGYRNQELGEYRIACCRFDLCEVLSKYSDDFLYTGDNAEAIMAAVEAVYEHPIYLEALRYPYQETQAERKYHAAWMNNYCLKS